METRGENLGNEIENRENTFELDTTGGLIDASVSQTENTKEFDCESI